MLFFRISALASVAAAACAVFADGKNVDQIISAGDHDALKVEISTDTGAMTILVDDKPWLHGGGSPLHVDGWPNLSILSVHTKDGNDQAYGPFHSTTLVWGSSENANALVETSVISYSEHELVVFEQHWPKGWSPRTTESHSEHSQTRRTILAAFPSIDTTSPTDLGFLTWGGCQISDPRSGSWDGTHNFLFDGVTHGEPLLLHDKGSVGKTRALVLSPMRNFFVSGQAASLDGKSIDCGIRNSVRSLPKGFSHASVLVAGHGINGTMMDWGDVLLGMGGKQRTDPYSDFVLGHLGYWTDNGAYYYGIHTNYSNSEEALKAVKADFAKRQIPVRYFQWDDWWMKTKGDNPGIMSWVPEVDVFPSGFTDWLDMPLSLYAPMYYSENDWTDRYNFKKDPNGHPTAIPLDPKFYQDLFRNGTAIGMKMFEQDFLCSHGIGGTGLTSTDVDTGRLWMEQMDAAAIATGTKLQFCMMDPCHALHSTLVKSMTNGRSTSDNTRNYDGVRSMGQDGLLFYSLGFFPSRDNVWTTNADTEQPSCGENRYCFEPNAHADNAAAVLAGGPYGPADAVGFTNRTLVMYGCRDDGVMLRPRWPLSSLDFTFTDPEAKFSLVFAAHDEFGPFRWSYIMGIDLDKNISITPKRLQGVSPGPMVAWKVQVGIPVTVVLPFSDDSGHLVLPSSVRPPKGPSLSHWAAAPVLPNDMALLGEVSKWATMSFRRVASFKADSSSVTAVLLGARGEKVDFAYVPATSSSYAVSYIRCEFSHDCDRTDDHGNTDCLMALYCTGGKCTCRPLASSFLREGDSLIGETFLRAKETTQVK